MILFLCRLWRFWAGKASYPDDDPLASKETPLSVRLARVGVAIPIEPPEGFS